jgi:hypothetical protein
MKTPYFSYKLNKRGGYALLLGLLITMIIVLVIYYQFMHGPVYEIDGKKSDIEPPWRQWHNMQGRIYRNEIGSPAECQPQLSKPLQVACKTKQDDKDRGEINVLILPDGKVQGGWGGAFYINKDVDFQVINCKFDGLVDPMQVFSDEEGEDPTKLFFIAKGNFAILETNTKSGQVRNLTGDAYARGWMDVNYIVNGELIMTPDNKSFFRYTWQGEATEPSPLFLEGLGGVQDSNLQSKDTEDKLED